MLVTRVMLDTNFNSRKLSFVSIAHNRFYRPLEDIKVGGNVWLNTFYISYSALLQLHNQKNLPFTGTVIFLLLYVIVVVIGIPYIL